MFHDRLSLPFMTVKFANELLTASDLARSRPHLFSAPVLFVHGDRDEITCPRVRACMQPRRRSIESSCEFER